MEDLDAFHPLPEQLSLKESNPTVFKLRFFVYFLIGALSCGLSHTLLTPLEVVKIRMHSNPKKYGKSSVYKALKKMYKKGGIAYMYTGWLPTMIGYSLQGAIKFISFEYLMYIYGVVIKDHLCTYLTIVGLTEFVADIFLAPFEIIKIEMQYHIRLNKNMTYCMQNIYRKQGLRGFYRGIVLLWSRQIPHTMMRKGSYDKAKDILYVRVMQKADSECSFKENMVVSFVASYMSAVVSSLISNPADYLVSRHYAHPGRSVHTTVQKAEITDLWTGLLLRIFMLGTISFLVILLRYLYKSHVSYRQLKPS